jgi:hypothetical protein
MKSTAEVKAKDITLIHETLPQENKVAEVVGFIEALKSSRKVFTSYTLYQRSCQQRKI